MKRKNTVLVTGATGFTGKYVIEALLRKQYAVIATGQSSQVSRPLADIKPDDDFRYIRLDLTDPQQIHAALWERKVDYVIHLAGLSDPTHQNPVDYYAINLVGTINLLEVLGELIHVPQKIVISSTALVYRPQSRPVEENDELGTYNHYGLSKLLVEKSSRHYSNRIPIVIARPFNYAGVGQPKRNIVPKLINFIKNEQGKVSLDNLAIFRDYSDVRFVADAYVELLTANTESFDVVNICSSQVFSFKDLLKILGDISQTKADISLTGRFERNTNINYLCGSNNKLLDLCPNISKKSIYETLDWMYKNAS